MVPNAENKVVIAPTYVKPDLPVFVCDLTPITPQLLLARQALDELRLSHPESTPSNVKATYMSPWKSHMLNPKFGPLCASVAVIAKEASRRFLSADFDALNLDLVVADCWGIFYERSDYTAPHNHFPSDFSCAIYLEAEENSAPIVFGGGAQVQPRPGLLVLFPGILQHEVPASEGRRVVVAMNFIKHASFRPDAVAGM